MTPFQAAVLGTIQGLTEFLPVSSSAHLFVVPTLLGWRYEGVAFDVALHWGTLAALLAAFGRDWLRLIGAAFAGEPAARREAWGTVLKLGVASVPAAVAGVLLEDAADRWLRVLPLQAAMLVLFGFLLWWVDRSRPADRGAGSGPLAIPGWGPCFLVGCAQALALVPGVSRSGITITAARAIGVPRVSAARLSFLLATPITLGAGLLELRHMPHDVPAATLAIGVGAAAVTGVIAIRGLLRWLNRAGFGAFFAYRTALASVILLFLFRR
jgi:undecaprenyl-diphosphatase